MVMGPWCVRHEVRLMLATYASCRQTANGNAQPPDKEGKYGHNAAVYVNPALDKIGSADQVGIALCARIDPPLSYGEPTACPGKNGVCVHPTIKNLR